MPHEKQVGVVAAVEEQQANLKFHFVRGDTFEYYELQEHSDCRIVRLFSLCYAGTL